MRTDFQPNVDTEFSHGIDGRDELYGLSDATTPMGGGAILASMTLAGDRAEEWNGLSLRGKFGEFFCESVRRRLHHGVMKRVVHADKTGKDPLGLQFRYDSLERDTRSRKRE